MLHTLLPTLVRSLEHGDPVIRAVVCAVRGSAPAGVGSSMLFFPDGRTLGSVGGGQVEEATRLAARRLVDLDRAEAGASPAQGRAQLLHFDLDQDAAAAHGMICGGSVGILVETIPAGPENLSLFQAVLERLESGQPCALVTECTGLPETETCMRRLVGPSGEVLAGPDWPQGTAPLPQGLPERPGLLEGTAPFLFVEPVRPLPGLFIFGAGHVGQAVARLVAGLEFSLTVVDDRPEYADPALLPRAAAVLVEHPALACGHLDIGPEDFLLILTRGHALDQEVLAQALATPARFIGMIGSRRKREAVFQILTDQGFGPADLSRVRCPVGLDIGAKTIEEIAVSIAAQLVAELHKPRQRPAPGEYGRSPD